MTFDQVCKRAGGRRRYNAQRQESAALRRLAVGRMLADDRTRAEIAQVFGVSQATVCRDIAAIYDRLGMFAVSLYFVGRMSARNEQRILTRLLTQKRGIAHQ